MYKEHLQRIREAALDVYHLNNLAAWVERSVVLEGSPYTFGAKYGFQRDILNDTSRVVNTVKVAQIGMTTVSMAYGLAAAATQAKYNGIYALPTANDATKLVVTKMNPLIWNSPTLLRLLNKQVDSTELKEINNNFIFIRGTKSETSALSISADYLVVDEIDRCDPDTVKQYRSRLQASPYQIVKQFSTPTLEGVGIAREAKSSKRYRHFATCSHCNNVWLPSYHTDIKIPGYSFDLKEITEENIKDVQWQKAYWCCPSCGKDPDLHPSRLQWVCENPSENYEASTYFVSPITACLVLRPSYLVRTSTEYKKRSEWRNQVLGETAEDANEQLVLEDLLATQVDYELASSDVHVLGADIGLLCALTVGRITQDGHLIIVHREMVPVYNLTERRLELCRQYRVVASVHDAYPYTTEITRICDYDPNAYGVIFSQSKSPELYTLQEKEEDKEEGKLNLRLLKANRTVLLDTVLAYFKSKKVLMKRADFNHHYLSLKRTQVFVRDELQFVWQKTDGEDHMMFSLAYMLLAWEMRTRRNWSDHKESLVRSFKMKSVATSTLALFQ